MGITKGAAVVIKAGYDAWTMRHLYQYLIPAARAKIKEKLDGATGIVDRWEVRPDAFPEESIVVYVRVGALISPVPLRFVNPLRAGIR